MLPAQTDLLADIQPIDLEPPSLASATSCNDFARIKRERLLYFGSPAPNLRPRGYRVPRRRLDPCHEPGPQLNQALSDMLGVTNPDDFDEQGRRRCRRVCKVPSLFTAQTAREALVQFYELGFTDKLSDATVGNGGRSRIGGDNNSSSGEVRQGQVSSTATNLLQPRYRYCRSPSVFTCPGDNGACSAALYVQLGFQDVLATQEQRQLNSGRANGLGGGYGAGQNVYDNQCVRVVRFGAAL